MRTLKLTHKEIEIIINSLNHAEKRSKKLLGKIKEFNNGDTYTDFRDTIVKTMTLKHNIVNGEKDI